jgi:hypothetical protein
MRRRRTDYVTVILHWLLVAALGVAFLTGLRIATESPDRSWIDLLDSILPRDGVWGEHIEAALVLVAIAIAYPIFLLRSGLSRRVRLDALRVRGLFSGTERRLRGISLLLTWAFFAAMLVLIVSGGCLYFGWFADCEVAMAHWYASWAIPVFAGLHVALHFKIGGASQLLRIFRPERLPPPPARLDAVELLTLLVAQSDQSAAEPPAPTELPRPAAPASHAPGRRRVRPHEPVMRGGEPRAMRRPRHPTLQANPFLVAAAVAITGASFFVASDWVTGDTLRIHRIASAAAPVLDGDTSDPVWRNIAPLSVMTTHGGNFDGTGETRIDIRAVHDGTWAYFLFTWQDPTRSLKQLPLIKEVDGWHLLHNGYERGDEHDYNEDKFSVLLTTSDVDLAGDHTFHAGPQPIANAPATMSGRGLHYTRGANIYADVWEWKATSDAMGWMDDDHFGPPLAPTPLQVRHVVPYRGGFAPDPGTVNYSENFAVPADLNGENPFVLPRRLPRDLVATRAAMGSISLDPNVSESDGARWFMTEAESAPFSPELDKTIPVGTVIPGVIISGEFSGDRADVRCAARWASGHWALEVARRLDTKSPYDVRIRSGVYMRVAAFDHSQIRHTRHVKPIRLEVE